MIRSTIKNKPSYVFIGAFLTVMIAVYYITGMHPNYYNKNPVNFSNLTGNQYVLTSSLTDAEIAAIKLDYINNTTPPEIGLYGHHIIKGMGREAFDKKTTNNDFFNFWFDHISLIEVRDLLLQLEKSNKLPKELILVYLSHPYIGKQVLTEYRWEMPTTFYNNFQVTEFEEIIEKGQHIFSQISKTLGLRLDWKHAGYSIIKSFFNFCRIHGIYDKNGNIKKAELPEIFTYLNNYGLSFVSNKIKTAFDAQCSTKNIKGLSNDGSHYGTYDIVPEDFYENPQTSGTYTNSVMGKLSLIIEDINNIGKRNNIRIVFFSPPRVQKYFPNSGHEQFDVAFNNLKQKGIEIIDHRNKHQSRELFHDRGHVNNQYFKLLLKELTLNR